MLAEQKFDDFDDFDDLDKFDDFDDLEIQQKPFMKSIVWCFNHDWDMR